MQPIFLVGYMGCGKSTLGRTVSAITGCRFIDLDTYIEGRYHRTVKELLRFTVRAGSVTWSVICSMKWGSLRMWWWPVAAAHHVFSIIWIG